MTERVILISGPQWVPLGFFQKFYEARIRTAFDQPNTRFVLGAANGVDLFAQRLLEVLCTDDFSRVTVYNKKQADGRVSDKFGIINGYESFPLRDAAMAAMAAVATEMIVCLPLFGGGVSGTVMPLLKFHGKDVKTTDVLRQNSEPWNEDVLKTHIVALYPSNLVAKKIVDDDVPVKYEMVMCENISEMK